MSEPKVIAEIERSSRAVLRCDLSTFKGHRLAALREWVIDPRTAALVATQRGCSFPVALLPAVAAALVAAERAANELGWLPVKTEPANENAGQDGAA